MFGHRKYFWGACLLSVCTYFMSCSHTSVSPDEKTALYRGLENRLQQRNVASEVPVGAEKMFEEARLARLENEAKIDGGHVHFPEGLTGSEAFDLWHISEGSEVFPVKWFLNLKSLTLKNPGSDYLQENLDKKFGVIVENPQAASSHKYPMKWIGLTATWSDEDAEKRDVLQDPRLPASAIAELSTNSRGMKSIAMTGVNCTFCHSTQINIMGQTRMIDGAPNMLNIRGFFEDEFGSLAQTMLTKKYLKDYLDKIDYRGSKDNEATATDFANRFRVALGLLPDHIKSDFISAALSKVEDHTYPTALENKKVDFIKKSFFNHRDQTEKFLVEFLKMTYGMKDEDVSNELHLRMHWLAVSIGADPAIVSMNDGYARTDAFGRIANLVARFDHPIALTGSASVPPSWNIKYRSMFHWNSNTNSVVMRNLGQSFGLGAILLHPGKTDDDPPVDFDSTANLRNVLKLERLFYKVQIPQMAIDYQVPVDAAKYVAGCNLYRAKCIGCHGASAERVGPTKELIDYHVVDVEYVKTDPQYLINQSTPVNGVPFRTALFNFTGSVKKYFYTKNNVSEQEQIEEEHRDLRGTERFRDTYLGEKSYSGYESYLNTKAKAGDHPGYIARPLAGVWATAPYLHNGSVPTIWDLLAPENERPRYFFTGSRDYDLDKLGYKSGLEVLPVSGLSEAEACKKFPGRCIDVQALGNSNRGHSGSHFTIADRNDRANLIEFLKVLRPDPEYSRQIPLLYSIDAAGSCLAVKE